MLFAGCMVPTAGSEVMERIMLWQITNLHHWGCATYLNGASLFHRLTEHCIALSTAGETVITNVTIETIGEAKIHYHVHVFHVTCSLWGCSHQLTWTYIWGVPMCLLAHSRGFNDFEAWSSTSSFHVSVGNGTA